MSDPPSTFDPSAPPSPEAVLADAARHVALRFHRHMLNREEVQDYDEADRTRGYYNLLLRLSYAWRNGEVAPVASDTDLVLQMGAQSLAEATAEVKRLRAIIAEGRTNA